MADVDAETIKHAVPVAVPHVVKQSAPRWLLGPEIARHAIGLAMVDCGKHSLAWSHGIQAC